MDRVIDVPETDSPEAIELRTTFLAAMRKLAATICLVTTCEEGQPHGMAATAVCSLSADPPSLLACVKRTASLHGPVSRAKWFCVNLLGQHQSELFEQFTSRKGSSRFEVGTWTEGSHRLPCLEEAVATITCFVDQQVECATHTIFIGTVVAAHASSKRQPLLYQDGNVGQFVAAARPASAGAIRLGNVIYSVSNLERAIGFYRDVLGLHLKLRDADRWAAFDGGGATIALEPRVDTEESRAAKTSLKLDGDLEQFVARVQAAGARVGAIRSGVHERTALLSDPDGNEFTLYVPRMKDAG